MSNRNRGVLTTTNIVEACRDMPALVIEQIQEIIDAEDFDLPDEALEVPNIIRLQRLQSYYDNHYPFLVGLWGVLRYTARRDDPRMVAMRDYLEKAASACKLKSEGASRMLTHYQEIREQGKEGRRL